LLSSRATHPRDFGMGPVVVSCDGCGVRIRIARPEAALDRACPRCGTALVSALTRAFDAEAGANRPEIPITLAIDPGDAPAAPDEIPEQFARRRLPAGEPAPPALTPTVATRPGTPPPPVAAEPAAQPTRPDGEPKRLRIRTKSGETVVGRVYGYTDGKTSVL